jgi:hypothetical protein
MRTERVRLERGTTRATVVGSIKGSETVDDLPGARKGNDNGGSR